MGIRFFLSDGRGYSAHGYKESYMLAEEDAYTNIEEGLEGWLEENMPKKYSMELDIVPDITASYDLYVEFENEEDAMAYILRWE